MTIYFQEPFVLPVSMPYKELHYILNLHEKQKVIFTFYSQLICLDIFKQPVVSLVVLMFYVF